MHRVVSIPGEGTEQVTELVEQPPAPVLFLTSASTDITTLSSLLSNDGYTFWHNKLRALEISHISHKAQIDHYINTTAKRSKIIIVRFLGGKNYWPYGFEQLVEWSKIEVNRKLIIISATDENRDELNELSNISMKYVRHLSSLLNNGGADNYSKALEIIKSLMKNNKIKIKNSDIKQHKDVELTDWKKEKGDKVAIILYKSYLYSGDTSVSRILNTLLRKKGLSPRTIWVNTLREKKIQQTIFDICKAENIKVILTATSFSSITDNSDTNNKIIWDQLKIPIIQLLCSNQNHNDWLNSNIGLNPIDLSLQIVLPELDGRVSSRPCAFKTKFKVDKYLYSNIELLEPYNFGLNWVVDHTKALINLGKLDNRNKKVTIVLANYPIKDGRVANGVGLDTPASILQILNWLKEEEYSLGNNQIPNSGKNLMQLILSKRTNSPETLNNKPIAYLTLDQYNEFWDDINPDSKKKIIQRWGQPEESKDLESDGFPINGIKFGNILITVQPARGYDNDTLKDIHSPDLPPPHRYLAQYYWIRKFHNTNIIINLGKHGSLEWLPGKGVGLGSSCFPNIILDSTPNIYPFIVNDPGEGSQAKRRTQSVIVDHLPPPLGLAGLHGDQLEIESLLDEYYESVYISRERSIIVKEKLISLLIKTNWPGTESFNNNVDNNNLVNKLFNDVEAYLCELKESQIRTGLHIFGKESDFDKIIEMYFLILKTPTANRLGITQKFANELNLNIDPWADDPDTDPSIKDIKKFERILNKKVIKNRDIITYLDNSCIKFLHAIKTNNEQQNIIQNKLPSIFFTETFYEYIKETDSHIWNGLVNSYKHEKDSLLSALDAKRVRSGPSGCPTRGRPEVLPTGKNFYSVDLRSLPTEAAWDLGRRSAQNILDLYLQEKGEHLTKLALSVWGTSTMRNGGEDIGQLLYLIGVKPIWEGKSRRVVDFEIIPTYQLDRPRVDVTLRISGLFRDAFPNLIDFINKVQDVISSLNESSEENPLAKSVRDGGSKQRIYGSAPGSYGAGLQEIINSGNWSEKKDLANAYISWSKWSYLSSNNIKEDKEGLTERLKETEVVLHNQDNREHDILDSDDYYQFQGGLAVTIEHLSGNKPEVLISDNSRYNRPVLKKLSKEIDKVMRTRVLNPRWINGMIEHGFKGAFEMGATVDYLFGYAATTSCVANWCYKSIVDKWLKDNKTYNFIKENNPHVLRDIAERLLEAKNRKLWNTISKEDSDFLKSVIYEAESIIEKKS
tara:strand:- start:35210 stop:38944 length:3735 start_codon:yes stop_codon:yes gene_type:complete